MRFVFAAGGTGGHIYPALAIADELRRTVPDSECFFVGTKDRLEARIVPQHGYTLKTIWISGFRRGIDFRNFLFPVKVFVALIQSYMFLRKVAPVCVIGTGGFVCGPVLFVASLLGIPTLVHESNSYPGMTTRLLAGRVTKVLLAFDETKKWLKATAPTVVVGTPTRETLGTVSREEALKHFGLNATKPTVLVLGGSQGAAALNRAMGTILPKLCERGIQVLWQTGDQEYEKYKQYANESNVRILAFIHSMEYAYSAADVVVCRAGAMTVAELTRLGKASILVPYPHAAGDHQRMNAQVLANAGAAVMILESELEQKLLPQLISLLENQEVRQTMEAACRTFGTPTATKDIVHHILTMVNRV